MQLKQQGYLNNNDSLNLSQSLDNYEIIEMKSTNKSLFFRTSDFKLYMLGYSDSSLIESQEEILQQPTELLINNIKSFSVSDNQSIFLTYDNQIYSSTVNGELIQLDQALLNFNQDEQIIDVFALQTQNLELIITNQRIFAKGDCNTSICTTKSQIYDQFVEINVNNAFSKINRAWIGIDILYVDTNNGLYASGSNYYRLCRKNLEDISQTYSYQKVKGIDTNDLSDIKTNSRTALFYFNNNQTIYTCGQENNTYNQYNSTQPILLDMQFPIRQFDIDQYRILISNEQSELFSLGYSLTDKNLNRDIAYQEDQFYSSCMYTLEKTDPSCIENEENEQYLNEETLPEDQIVIISQIYGNKTKQQFQTNKELTQIEQLSSTEYLYLTNNGEVYLYQYNTQQIQQLFFPKPVIQIAAYNNRLIALLNDNKTIYVYGTNDGYSLGLRTCSECELQQLNTSQLIGDEENIISVGIINEMTYIVTDKYIYTAGTPEDQTYYCGKIIKNDIYFQKLLNTELVNPQKVYYSDTALIILDDNKWKWIGTTRGQFCDKYNKVENDSIQTTPIYENIAFTKVIFKQGKGIYLLENKSILICLSTGYALNKIIIDNNQYIDIAMDKYYDYFLNDQNQIYLYQQENVTNILNTQLLLQDTSQNVYSYKIEIDEIIEESQEEQIEEEQIQYEEDFEEEMIEEEQIEEEQQQEEQLPPEQQEEEQINEENIYEESEEEIEEEEQQYIQPEEEQNQEHPTDNNKKENKTGMIVGIVLGIVAAICIVIVIVILYYKKSKTHGSKAKQMTSIQEYEQKNFYI